MKTRFFLKTLVFFVVLLPMTDQAKGASSWVWEQTLKLSIQQGGVMHLPVGLYADDESQRYYVADGGNNRILAFDRSGQFISSFTAGNSLLRPYALIREPGFLWIVERGRNTLTGIDLEKKKVVPHKIEYEGRLLYPDRIAKDGDTFYVLDKASGRIFSLDKNLNVRESFECAECRGGFVDFKFKNNRIWALAQQDHEVQQFNRDGKLVRQISLDKKKTEFPRSLAVDEGENVYILDRHAGKVSVYDRNGSFKYEFLEPGNSRGQLYYPVEVQFDPWGRICIVDEGNGRVQIYSRK